MGAGVLMASDHPEGRPEGQPEGQPEALTQAQAQAQAQALRFGSHHAVVDGLILVVRTDGPFTEVDAKTFMDFVEAQHDRLGNLGLLVFVSGSVSFTPQARQHMGSRTAPDLPGLPMAVLGASLIVRTVLTLVVNAIRLTSRQGIPLRFFSSEETARGWLTEQLGVRAAQLANLSMRR